MAWTEHQRAMRRAEYARHHSTSHAGRAQGIIVPDNVERFDGDGSPCFNCGSRDGCRHRPWMLAS